MARAEATAMARAEATVLRPLLHLSYRCRRPPPVPRSHPWSPGASRRVCGSAPGPPELHSAHASQI
eukprot:5716860-Prymnesium_polylepis.1